MLVLCLVRLTQAVATRGHTGAASPLQAAGPGGSAPGSRQRSQVRLAELAKNLKGSRNIHVSPFNNYGELRALGKKTMG